jgi:chaperonin GroES
MKEIHKIIPLRDQVILKIRQREQKGSFIIPSPGKESREPGIGEIIAMGDGNLENGEKISMPFSLGDLVIYNSWSTTALNDIVDPVSEDKYISLSAKDIVLKFKGDM